MTFRHHAYCYMSHCSCRHSSNVPILLSSTLSYYSASLLFCRKFTINKNFQILITKTFKAVKYSHCKYTEFSLPKFSSAVSQCVIMYRGKFSKHVYFMKSLKTELPHLFVCDKSCSYLSSITSCFVHDICSQSKY